MKRKLTALAVLVSVLILAVPCYAAQSGVTVYCNEAKLTNVDCIVSDGKTFVPLDVYSAFGYVTVYTVEGENMFVVRNGRTGGEISALPAIERAWVNGSVVYVDVKQIDGKYYVDGEFVSVNLGFTYEETDTPSGRKYVRISEGKEKMTLDAMLRATVPAEYGAEFDTPVKKDGISLVLVGMNEYTSSVAERLTESDTPACFAFTRAEIESNPIFVAELISDGFDIAISAADGYADVSEANRLLCLLTMKNTHLVYGGDDGTGYKNIAPSEYADAFDYVTGQLRDKAKLCVLYIDETTESVIDYAEIIGADYAELTVTE